VLLRAAQYHSVSINFKKRKTEQERLFSWHTINIPNSKTWNTNMPNTIFKAPEVLKIARVSRNTLETMISNGQFPAPIRLSKKSIGWVSGEIQAWIDSKIAERDAAKGASETDTLTKVLS
jgi:prophage regulatory protein